ncbi:MAG: metallophosphoesterase [Hyphomicrobiales bacterium]|nr:metallophosphoesterase [Hyphomicrobiales bacterium]
MLITRRNLLTGTGGLLLGSTALGSYAFAIEPGFMLDVTRYRVQPKNWPAGLDLKIAIIADIHACEPWMGPERIRKIAHVANAMKPDLIALLGDFNAGHRFVTAPVTPTQWAEALSVLKAPLGLHAVLGNHDWWHGVLPGMKADDGEGVRRGLKQLGAKLYENDAERFEKNGQPFWIVGLGDLLAYPVGRMKFRGVDDMEGALAAVDDDAPIVLLAHEPQAFRHVPKRVAVTLCGHTHGGQVNLPIAGPVIAERRFSTDLIYGHTIEDDRHLIISAGLGTSILPVRFMRPPEVVEVTISAPGAPTV